MAAKEPPADEPVELPPLQATPQMQLPAPPPTPAAGQLLVTAHVKTSAVLTEANGPRSVTLAVGVPTVVDDSDEIRAAGASGLVDIH